MPPARQTAHTPTADSYANNTQEEYKACIQKIKDAGFYAIGAYGTAIIHNYLNLPPMLSILSHLVGYVSPDTFVRKQRSCL